SEGYLATANDRPRVDDPSLILGADYLDFYRVARIRTALASRSDWDLDAVLALQLDVHSLPWNELRSHLLSAPVRSAAVAQALAVLRQWDGCVSADSIAASIFELTIHRLAARLAQARAPRSWPWIVGAGFHDLAGGTSWGVRRIAHLVRVLQARPQGWSDRDWDTTIAETLEEVMDELHRRYGSDPGRWSWGDIRPLTLSHPLGAVSWLRWLFDRGPYRVGGDANTVNPAGVSAHDPLGPVQFIASLRFAVELGAWDDTRVVLPGGQSGHPLSRHYDDLLRLWLRGETIPLAWSRPVVERLAQARLELVPARR
ncbi:MAG: penicillin acylase family protein, partial [Thermomicrobium sp.]|nr:penicillin acylase family protein [Thermomicrobium sp.]